MAKRKVFIQHAEFVPEVAEITGTNIIYVEYQFRRAEILDIVCVFEVELTAEQAAEIDRRAKVKRGTMNKADARYALGLGPAKPEPMVRTDTITMPAVTPEMLKEAREQEQ